ncbi:MAG TPA: sortase, partial [Acidimicrobiales bacterium]|nr:sortase [Acidimicrobiales bacterium]
MRLARVLRAVGRAATTAGVLVLLFVAYQLWGTGIREAQAQDRLEDELAQRLGEDQATVGEDGGDGTGAGSPGGEHRTEGESTGGEDGTDPSDGSPTGSSPDLVGSPPPSPAAGDAVARLRIPRIGVDKVVVEGVQVDDLKRGPGHYPDSPLPGQPGNAAIAGHRTTYGAPFFRLNELDPGDPILVTTRQG